MQFLSAIAAVAAFLAATATPMPAEEHPETNNTHAILTIDGSNRVLDLTTPDVIHRSGTLLKAIGPNPIFYSGSEPHPELQKELELHDKRDGSCPSQKRDGVCSMYFACQDQYVNILPGTSLWSYIRTPYGRGCPDIGGHDSGVTVDAATSRIVGQQGHVTFSGNQANSGCYIRFILRNCEVHVPSTGTFGSYNCAGC